METVNPQTKYLDSYGDTRQSHAAQLNPCRNVLAILISDAFSVRDLVAQGNPALLGQLESDRIWLQIDNESAWSFQWVCNHLGLDPTSIRERYFEGAPLPSFR